MSISKIRSSSRILLCAKNFVRNRSTNSAIQPETAKVSSVDDGEVLKHVRLSEGWWNEQGDMKALHSMNKLRVQFIRDGIIFTRGAKMPFANSSRPLADLKILDVGCGGGILSEPLARIGADVTGIDPGQKLIDVAKYHAEEDPELSGKISYVCEDIKDHAVDNVEKYDAVIASEVIEHVQAKDEFIESCSSVLKPGGSLFFTTINRTTEAWIAGVVTAEYLLNLVPRDTHDWEKFITPLELQYMCEKYDCYTKIVHGMLYNILNNEWYWAKNAVINYALHAVKKK